MTSNSSAHHKIKSIDEVITSIHEDYIQKDFPKQYNHDFEILSTIRYDPLLSRIPPMIYDEISSVNFFLLSEHIERLKFTLAYFHHQFKTTMDFEITESGLLEQLIRAMKYAQRPVMLPYKYRVLVDLSGNVRVEIHDTDHRDDLLAGMFPCLVDETLMGMSNVDEVWDVYIDSKQTLISPFTSFKTTKRDAYNEVRARILPGLRPGKEEVLLYNTSNKLMEGSITNVAIKRFSDGKWITPLLSSGCLCGVTRSFLLKKDFIEEDSIDIDDLLPGMDILLFNGVMGVVRGRIIG
ncbi:ABZ2 [[Candida] subhashii]|uniref:ABZ2 n=1 Tax=[Candida] subhashii TaxID=561895 RepID=A0A8J5UM61_9ASCO|nr:ABZ2 [[Candida] subhashii]KAG7662912.1 ABZ2 [[Candida] subhashii]